METKGVYSPMDRHTVTQTAMTILNKPYPLFRDEKPTRYIDLAKQKIAFNSLERDFAVNDEYIDTIISIIIHVKLKRVDETM